MYCCVQDGSETGQDLRSVKRMNEMTMLGAVDRRRHSSRDRPMERGTKEFGSDCDARAVSQP